MPKRSRREYTPEERAEALALYATDGPTTVQQQLGIPKSTVQHWAREAGVRTVRTGKTRAATEARVVDLAARRSELAEQAVEEARRLFGLLTSPHEVTHWDKDGVMHRDVIATPTSGDVKNYAIAAGILIDKHAALVKMDAKGEDHSAVDAWLTAVMDGGAS